MQVLLVRELGHGAPGREEKGEEEGVYGNSTF